MNDKEIMFLFEQRSEEAIKETEKKYGAYCSRIAYGILRNEEDVKECLNDTYLQAWNSIPPNNPENLATYLGKITRNLSINKARNQKRKKRGGGQVELALEELEGCIPSVKGNAEQRLEHREIKRVINGFLAEQPERERIVFVQRYWYLLSIREIASQQEISESKVMSLLFRQRKRLKKVLEKEGILL